jgi:acyl carrier protein
MKEIFEKVAKIVAEQLSVELSEVKLESKFVEDLGADSLDTVELLMALEESFDCEIDEAVASSLLSVQDIISYIKELEVA